MSLFSSPSSISLGICFSESQILAVRLHQEKGILLAKQAIPEKTIERGSILNEQAVVSSLVDVVHIGEEERVEKAPGEQTATVDVVQLSFLQRLKNMILRRRVAVNTSGKLGAAVCVHPACIYTALLCIPSIVGKELEGEVLERIEKTVPIQADDMVVVWKQIGKSQEHQHVAVAAMSKALLQQYTILCEKQKLRLESLSTPASIIWLAAAAHQKDMAVLVARLDGISPLSAYMYNSWPVDEVVLPEKTSLKEQVKQTKEMIDQQLEINGLYPKRIVFIGSNEEFALLKQSDFDIPVERTSFAVPDRLQGYELGLFPILSARKDRLLNLLEGVGIEEE